MTDSDGHAGRGAQAALACRASSACTRTTTSRSPTNFGRFGPYVKHGDEFRSLESEDDVFDISFDAALALLRAPKQSRRRQAAQKKMLRELTQDGTTLKLLAGRYGPYVTDGTTNASIPKTTSSRGADLRAGRRAAGRAS